MRSASINEVRDAGSASPARETRALPGRVVIAMIFLALAAVAAAQDLPEVVKQRVLEHARTITGNEYAFTRTARTEQEGGPGAKTRVAVERFDPSKPARERWTLVSVDGREPTADELKRHAAEAPKRPVGLYARVANYFGARATSAMENGRVVFRFAALPKNSVLVNNSDLSSSSSAEAVVDTSGAQPFVRQTRFSLQKPVRMKLVAKIDRFDATTTYRLQPDGVPLPVEQQSITTGSLMGQEGTIRTTLRYGDFRRVGR